MVYSLTFFFSGYHNFFCLSWFIYCHYLYFII
jgi:hypothetical protein